MKKYKIKIKEHIFLEENEFEFQEKIKELLSVGIVVFETGITEEQVPALTQEPCRETPAKHSTRADKNLPKTPNCAKVVTKRKRRTKEDMEKLYTKDIDDLIKDNYKEKSDKELVELIKTELTQIFSYEQIKNRRVTIGCHKVKGGQAKTKPKEKKIGKPKIYTDEVIKYLRENVNEFTNEELVVKLKEKFNVETTKSSIVGNLSVHKISRDKSPEVRSEIQDFILKSTQENAFYMRDDVIEKFEEDIGVETTRKIISQRVKFSGESDIEEMKRIKEMRENAWDDEEDEDE